MKVKKIALIAAMMLIPVVYALAEGPGGPGTGNGSGGPNNGQYLGGNAPVDGGLSILLALGAVYGMRKRNKAKQ